MKLPVFNLNPVTAKRLRRFRQTRRAFLSLWITALLYLTGLAAPLLCNDRPLYVRHEGRHYSPVFRFYPDDIFTGSGLLTRPDYKAIATSPGFNADPRNVMLFPPIRFGPNEVLKRDAIAVPDTIVVTATPLQHKATVNIAPDLTISRSLSAGRLFACPDDSVRGLNLGDYWRLSGAMNEAIKRRFRNEDSPAESFPELRSTAGASLVTLSLSTFKPRTSPPATVRLTLTEAGNGAARVPAKIHFDADIRLQSSTWDEWNACPEELRLRIIGAARARLDRLVESFSILVADSKFRLSFEKQGVKWPFRPTPGHWLGVDSHGRDVLVRIVYGLRTAMNFGLCLVVFSMTIGTLIGAIQGYFGGAVDITGQRLIEIWSAMPFLYIMILVGSVYGRSFALLLFCYAIFNWIGISYYMRAEFLRLRGQPFVEAAKCMGTRTTRILFRHILPNALVPLITLFPFSLVSAIASLTALDYLGFGLPPPAASWGDLLSQAQVHRHAWWLILYPAASLFAVMFFGSLVGEGLRAAFNPKAHTSIR